MNVLIVTAVCLAVFGLLFFIDTKVKGNFSVITKALSVIAIAALLGIFILWYGQTIFETIQVDVKSLTNLKSFFNSRILGMLAILIYLLLELYFHRYLYLLLDEICIHNDLNYHHKLLNENFKWYKEEINDLIEVSKGNDVNSYITLIHKELLLLSKIIEMKNFDEKKFNGFIEELLKREFIVEGSSELKPLNLNFEKFDNDKGDFVLCEYKDVAELLLADPIHEVKEDKGWKPKIDSLK